MYGDTTGKGGLGSRGTLFPCTVLSYLEVELLLGTNITQHKQQTGPG